MNTLTDNSDLDAAKAAVQRSLDTLQVNQATLYTHDGHKINPPGKHESELARLLVGLETSVDKAVAVADRVSAEVESQRLAPFSDPTSALSAADLQDANARAPWIREDCETLPLGDLVERLKAVAGASSKSSRWLHWRYSKTRLDRELAKSQQDPALSVFAATCRELGVVGEKSGLSDEAQKRQEAAAALKRWATWQLQAARDPEKVAADKAKFAQSTRAMF